MSMITEAELTPLRSVLYVPASNPRALEKARRLPCDALILDLEDAVLTTQKENAQQNLLSAMRQGYPLHYLTVRVQCLEDIALFAALDIEHKPQAIVLPKVDDPAVIHEASQAMAHAGFAKTARLWAMMETPRGILAAPQIAASHPRLSCLVMGTSDLAKDLHAQHTPLRLPLIVSLGQCLLAARAYGLSILDGVYLDLSDAEGFALSCRQGLELGFDGKTLIHPKTIDVANQMYAPSEEALARAHAVCEVWKLAEAEGKGVTLLDGQLVEKLHVQEAERLIVLADKIAGKAQ